MRVLLICAFMSMACASTLEAKRPLTPEKIDELRSATRSRRVKVDSATAGGTPLSLELSDIDFEPEFLRGSAAEGVQTIPLSRVATVSWRSGAKGALFGLAVGPFLGAGLGTAIGAVLPHSCGPNCNDGEKQALNMLGGLAAGTLIGLFVGPVFGAVIGAERRIEFTPPGSTVAPPPAPLQPPNPNTN